MTPTRSTFLGSLLFAFVACSHPKHAAPPVPTNAGAPLVVATDPKLVTMTAEPTTSLVAAGKASHLGVRIQIRASELPDARRPPLNLALVLDTSGSMEGAAIDALKSSAAKLVSQMRDGDRVSVIAFHSRADILVPNVKLDRTSRTIAIRAIDKIAAKGTTDIAAGLTAGLQQIQSARFPNGINRIVLLSDGVPNSAAPLPNLVRTAHDVGIGITTLGLGVDYDSTLLAQMARDTGGTFHYLETPDAVAGVFDKELSRMSTVVGRNLQLAIVAGPGVTIEPMAGLVVGGDGHAYATIGDLAAGEQRDLMIPIAVVARADGSTTELIDAQLGFDDVIAQSGRLSRDGFVAVKASADKVAVDKAVKINLEVQRIRTTAASAILEAIALARQNQLAAARTKLANTAEVVRAASSRLGDPEFAKIVAQLDEVAKQLAQLVPPQPQVVMDSAGPAPQVRAPATAPAAIEMKLRRIEEKSADDVAGRSR